MSNEAFTLSINHADLGILIHPWNLKNLSENIIAPQRGLKTWGYA